MKGERKNAVQKNRIILPILCLVFCVLCAGCKSAGVYNDTGLVVSNQRAIQRLEYTTAELGAVYSRANERLDTIREQAAGIGNGISRLEYLFTEYDRQVVELLTEIDRIRKQAKQSSKANSGFNNNTDD